MRSRNNTPNHASWLNQIEIWFSILVRKLIRRDNFAWEPPLPSRFRNNSGRRVVAFGAEVGWLMADPPTSAPG